MWPFLGSSLFSSIFEVVHFKMKATLVKSVSEMKELHKACILIQDTRYKIFITNFRLT